MKLNELLAHMKKNNISAVVWLSSSQNKKDPNITYLSGIDLHDFSCLIVKKAGDAILLVNGFEVENAKKNSRIKDIRPLRRNLYKELKSLIRNPRTIGINKSVISVNEMAELKHAFKAKPSTKFVDIGSVLDGLREVKTEKEITNIETACRATDEIFHALIRRFRNFSTESDAASFIIAWIKRMGLEPSFPPIIASGKNAADPHHMPDAKPLQDGFCIIDFGVRYDNYCSDMSRTIYIGTPSKAQIELYDKIKGIQQEAIRFVRPGVKARDVDAFVRKRLGFDSRLFVHGLGHQLGIDIHENTKHAISPKGDFILKHGMAITIEPGIYSKRCSRYGNPFGIRIEDTVIVEDNKKGFEVLTKSDKKLISI